MMVNENAVWLLMMMMIMLMLKITAEYLATQKLYL